MSERIDKLLARQARQLDKLEDIEVKRMLSVYTDSRRELRENLRDLVSSGRGSTWSAAHMRAGIVQVESGMLQMQERLGGELDALVANRMRLALNHMLSLIRVAERGSLSAAVGSAIEVAAINRINQTGGLLLHRHSLRRYSLQMVERIQSEMVRSLTLQKTPFQVVEDLAGPNGVLAGQKHRAELIVRMETARAYDQGHQVSLEEAANELDADNPDDPMLKRADETRDKRTHPFSLALDGRLAPVKGAWHVPVAEVRAWAASTGRAAGGILWAQSGISYVGGAYPAHFNDRGRQTAWRRSWGPSAPKTPPKQGTGE